VANGEERQGRRTGFRSRESRVYLCARARCGREIGERLAHLLRPVSRSVPVLELRALEGTRGGRERSLRSTCESTTDSSSSGPSGKNDSRVKWKVSQELASEIGMDGVETAYGCAEMGGRAMALRERWGPDHSLSEAPGIVGISVLEQADILVGEGVGERVRCEKEVLRSRGRRTRSANAGGEGCFTDRRGWLGCRVVEEYIERV
jgi:hypothetical protein